MRYGYQKKTDNYILRVGLFQLQLQLVSMVNPSEPRIESYVFPDSLKLKPVIIRDVLRQNGIECDAVEIMSATHFYNEYALTREQVMSGTPLDITTHEPIPQEEPENSTTETEEKEGN